MISAPVNKDIIVSPEEELCLLCPDSPLLLLPHVHEIRLQGAASELAPVRLPRHQRSSTAHPGRTADPARVSRPLSPFVL